MYWLKAQNPSIDKAKTSPPQRWRLLRDFHCRVKMRNKKVTAIGKKPRALFSNNANPTHKPQNQKYFSFFRVAHSRKTMAKVTKKAKTTSSMAWRLYFKNG